jgi:hypothetical protein
MVQDLFSFQYRDKVEMLPDGRYNILEYSTSQGEAPLQKVISLVDGEYVITQEDLPTLTAKGYTFVGWYIGETEIKPGDVVTKNTVLTAVWDFTPGGGGGGDYTKWEVGDIVLYDRTNDKKVKSTKDDYTLEKFPLERYLPIGVVSFVNEDGTARMISLVNMSVKDPEHGTDGGESMPYGGYQFDVPELENYEKVGFSTEISESIDEIGSGGSIPSSLDTNFGKVSKDDERFYGGSGGSVSGGYIPSPYTFSGGFNMDFFRRSFKVGPFYCWTRFREDDDRPYYMYTDTQEITQDTILWCATTGGSSIVKNYGNFFKLGDPSWSSATAKMLGSIMDESVFDGGVESFLSEFTPLPSDTYERNYLLANSDVDGKSNCQELLKYQRDFNYDTHLYGDTIIQGNIPVYFWHRYNESDGRVYILYTSADENNLTSDTSIFIPGYTSDSFLYNYGTLNTDSMSLNDNAIEVGTIGDENYIEGGVEGFLSNFTRSSEGFDLYYWYRYNESDGNTYFLYTTDESQDLTVNTMIFIKGQFESFLFDYGTTNRYNSSTIRYIGTIGDENYIEGGVEGFLSHFTRKSTESWRTASPIMTDSVEGNYPIAVSTYRFNTVGTSQGDWYCPACSELTISFSNAGQIQESLRRVLQIASCPVASFLSKFNSSSECNEKQMWKLDKDSVSISEKGSEDLVRAMCHLEAL